jgi:ketosteroid isomerase-like protein
MTDRDAFPVEITQRQHEAEAALVRGDPEPRIAMWSHHDPVTLFAALGASKAGWGELEPLFRTVAARVSGGRDVSYELIAFDVDGDLAWTVGCSRFAVAIDGGEPVRRTLRLTHLYRREDGAWKVVHEHSDFQPADHEMPAPISGSGDQ